MVSQDRQWSGEGSAVSVDHAELLPVCYAFSQRAADRYCDVLGAYGIFALVGAREGNRTGSPVLVEVSAFERASEVLALSDSAEPGIDEDAEDFTFEDDDDDDDDDGDDDWDDDDDEDDDDYASDLDDDDGGDDV